MTLTRTQLSFRQLQWLFPIALTLHNVEEGIWLPAFAAAHRTQVPWTFTPNGFRIALVVLTAAAWIITMVGWRTGPQSLGTYLEFGYIITVLVNVLVPHVPAAIIFGGYAPGVVTAVVVNLPVLTLLSTLAIRERYVSGRKAVVFGVAVPLGIVAVLPVLFALGRWL